MANNNLKGSLIIHYFLSRQRPYFIRAAHGQNQLLEAPIKQKSKVLAGIFLLLAWAIIFPDKNAKAWGPKAHQVVGYVAEHFLQPDVKTILRQEFNIKHLAQVAVWADDVRKSRRQKLWHYSNVKEGKWLYLQERDCPQGNCVVERIKFYHQTLKNRDLPKKKRREAIKYLVHFIGDIHQPLHLGNQSDRGGNRINILFRGEHTNLHALWDSGIIASRAWRVKKYSRFLALRIKDEDASEWSDSTRVDWANESRRFALEHAYNVKKGRRVKLTKDYLGRANEIIDLRLSQAGVRLANILNQTLAE